MTDNKIKTTGQHINKDQEENEKKYKSLVENLPIGIAIHTNAHLVYINKIGVNIFGESTSNKFIKKPIWNILEKSQNQILKNWITEILTQSESQKSIEAKYISENGRVVYLELLASRIMFGQSPAIQLIIEEISLHKKTQNALIASEEKFKNLFEVSPTAKALITLEGVIFGCNQACCNLYNYNRSEMLGKYADIFVSEEDRDKALLAFEKMKKDEIVKNLQISCIKKNGEKFYGDISSSILKDEKGNPFLVIINIDDISIRKKAELALKESEERYKSIVENITDSLFIHDFNGTIIDLNDNACRLTGYTKDELIGNNIDIIGKEFISMDIINEIIEKKSLVIEGILLDKEKNKIKVNTSGKLISDKKNGLIQLFSRDITGQKQTEEDFKRIFNLSSDLICILNYNGNFITINPAFKSILGYKKDQLISQSIFDFIHPQDILKTKNAFKKKLQKNITINNFINRFRCLDGTYKWISWEIQPIPGENTAFSISRDITRQKIYEDEMVKAKEKAEQSDRLKTAFLANMSHEIRTPLNGIVGFSSLLYRNDIPSTSKSNYINIINKSSKQLLAIINDIIDISKIEAGQIDIVEDKCHINQILSELYSYFENEKNILRKNDIDIILEQELKNGQDIIKTDEVRLHQILTNLLSNALKFTKKGYVKIGYKVEKENTLFFYVEDTGIGISEDNINIIFERFTQEDDSNTRKFGGTGLGLAISKGLVNLLGGNIWVNSKKNEGSTFYFTIPYKPVKQSITEKTIKPEVEIIKYNWKDKNILIVDDTEEVLALLSEILLQTEANIIQSKTGNEAIKICENKKIHLILMDIQLPDINGYETTKKILKINNKLPIITQTAYALSGDKEKAFKAGCVDYIAKPINRELLLNKIEKHIL